MTGQVLRNTDLIAGLKGNQWWISSWIFPKIGVEISPKMDGENNGKSYEQMDDSGVPLFLETPLLDKTMSVHVVGGRFLSYDLIKPMARHVISPFPLASRNPKRKFFNKTLVVLLQNWTTMYKFTHKVNDVEPVMFLKYGTGTKNF